MNAQLYGGPFDGETVKKPPKAQRHEEHCMVKFRNGNTTCSAYLWNTKRKRWEYKKELPTTVEAEVKRDT